MSEHELCLLCVPFEMCTIRDEVKRRIDDGQTLGRLENEVPGAAGCPQVDEEIVRKIVERSLNEITEPVELDRPGKPVRPTTLREKAEPVKPAKHDRPDKSARLVRPAEPKEPAKPIISTKSTNNASSVAPAKPLVSSNKGAPERPRKPTKKTLPAKSRTPVELTDSRELDISAEPIDLVSDGDTHRVIFQFEDPEKSVDYLDNDVPEDIEVGELLELLSANDREEQRLLAMFGDEIEEPDEELDTIVEVVLHKPKRTPEEDARVLIQAELNRYEMTRRNPQTVEEIMIDFDITDEDDVLKFLGLLKIREAMDPVTSLQADHKQVLHYSTIELSGIPLTEKQQATLKGIANLTKDNALSIFIHSKQDLYLYLIHRIGRQWANQVNLRDARNKKNTKTE